MITFLIGQNGPHVGVIKDIISANNCLFREDFNSYVVLDPNYEIKTPYLKELIGNISKIHKNFYTDTPSDVVVAKYISDYLDFRLIHIDYPYVTANEDFAESVNEKEYNLNDKYINIALQAKLPTVEVDYIQFINDFEYRDNKILEILGEDIKEDFISNLDIDDPELGQSYFSDLVAKHHDLFAGKIVSEILDRRVKFDFDNQTDREEKMYRKINGV